MALKLKKKLRQKKKLKILLNKMLKTVQNKKKKLSMKKNMMATKVKEKNSLIKIDLKTIKRPKKKEVAPNKEVS
jgi:hypothetical protein